MIHILGLVRKIRNPFVGWLRTELVYRLAHNIDVAAGQLAVFQGGPSRTGGKAPIFEFIRVDPPRRRKNSQLAAARRVALKMGRIGETYRRAGVSAFAKHHQLRRDLLIHYSPVEKQS